MKALVTGGAGLIGSHIVDALRTEGHEVRILDNLEPRTHVEGRPEWVPADVEFIRGDVRSPSDLATAVRGVEVIFHQAAYGGFTPELSKVTDVNATGTARLFEAVRATRADVRAIVVASSQAVYGEGAYACDACGPFYGTPRPLAQLERGEWEMRCPTCGAPSRGEPIDEQAPLNLTGVYALSKHYEEKLGLCIGREWGIPVVALRYSLTYGPRQSVFNPYTGICSIFSTRLLNDMPPLIYEDGNQSRDLVFVEDVARANLLVAAREEAAFGIFNVGTGRATRIVDFARLLHDAYGAGVEPVMTGEFRPADCRHLVTDNSRLAALGWRPTVDVSEGVRRYAEWILSRPRPGEYFSQVADALRDAGIVRRVR
jgi:dTDP-L-rhamnose 4-epimerase